MVRSSGFRQAAVALVLVCVACTSEVKLRQAELGELATWLPGIYDNHGQVQAERQQGHTVHETVTLSIIPVYAPMLSDAAFYLQETAGDDERRIITQRIISLETSKDARIVEKRWAFAEPERWRQGARDPDLFKSMVSQDLRPAPGCELTWRKSEGRFKASNEPRSCGTSSLATADLGPTDLIVDEHAGTGDGSSEYRFTKRDSATR